MGHVTKTLFNVLAMACMWDRTVQRNVSVLMWIKFVPTQVKSCARVLLDLQKAQMVRIVQSVRVDFPILAMGWGRVHMGLLNQNVHVQPIEVELPVM
jgi:hypothetical protein